MALRRLIVNAGSFRQRPPFNRVRLFSTDDEWQRWHRLETKDESERLEFAEFIGRLQKRFPPAEVDPSAPGAETAAPAANPSSANQSDITFYQEVKMGCVERLMKDLAEGKLLSLQLITNLLDMAAPLLKSEPNVVQIDAPAAGQNVIVVGDLHGSLADLITIFELNGLPSADNVYIFNGDFVDRGSFGLEVLAVLLACKGNHEDRLLCQAYGFHEEVLQKANKRVFQDISGVFSLLPLATIINEVALVIHGGLPSVSSPECLIEDLQAIKRNQWKSTQRIDTATLSTEEASQLRLLKDVLWSDPDDSIQGTVPNPRGAGCLFGDDVVQDYLSHLGLQHLVRSHQPFFKGFATTRLAGGFERHTVFSASDYCGSQNFGAVVVFSTDDSGQVQREFVNWVSGSVSNIEIQKKAYELEIITNSKTRQALEAAFAESGAANRLNQDECDLIVTRATGSSMRWSDIVEIATNGVEHKADKVHFPAFLRNYEDFAGVRGQQAAEGAHMYKKQQQLQAVFRYFDSDRDGQISRGEWMDGCRVLNQELPEHEQFDGSRFFDILDMNRTGEVSLNELCEGFRISNLKQKEI